MGAHPGPFRPQVVLCRRSVDRHSETSTQGGCRALVMAGALGACVLACSPNGPSRKPPANADNRQTAPEATSKPERAQRRDMPAEASKPTPTSIHFVGRVAQLADGRSEYAWPGTGLIARFNGTGVAIRLADNRNEHQAVLDGRLLDKLVTRSTMTRYVLASHLPAGEHRLEIYRRTEASIGVTHFNGIEIEGGRLLDADTTIRRRIELVGDSISCGYGNEGPNAECHFSPNTENHYLSYGAILARTLNAELSTIAWSGRGVVKNYAGSPGDKLGALYERTLPASVASQWIESQPHDAVIVNVGTNDYSTEPDPDEAIFERGYVDLLERIRRHNPQAMILCTIGPMLLDADLERAEAGIAKAVSLRHAAGDQRVQFHRMRTRNLQPGCDWHPGLETHRRMAEEIAEPLRLALGWP